MVRLEADEQASGYTSGGRRPVVQKATSAVTDKGSFRAKLAERLSCRERRRKEQVGQVKFDQTLAACCPGSSQRTCVYSSHFNLPGGVT